MASIGSQLGSTTSVAQPSVTDGLVENVTIALANTEQSHTFPAGTKLFLLRARSAGKLQLSHTAGTSGSAYVTIPAGCSYRTPDFFNALKTIYFQSPTAGLVVEIESWA